MTYYTFYGGGKKIGNYTIITPLHYILSTSAGFGII